LTYQELEKHYEIDSAEDFKTFLKLLNQLEQAGKIMRTRRNRYGVPERMNLLPGRLQAHAKGFGFLLPDNKEHPDVYIHANDMNGAMNGDTILVRITSKSAAGGKLEGEVVRVVNRAITQIVGVYADQQSFGFVVPDDKRIYRDIFIPKEKSNGAQDGEKVVVKLVTYPEGRAAAEGEVIEVLGHKDDPGVDIISIIRKYQLPEAFPAEVMKEAEAAPSEIREEELRGRRDLRAKRIVTIDGEDAKDLDDAVNVERLPNGNYLLGVHIADVGYYVKEGSKLDKEAYQRGCSVYLVDRVIPMLPHRLSNGICSLNPQVDRLTMTCEMEIDESAKVVRHDIYPSVIKTTERMTYTNVRKIVKREDDELLERYRHVADDFFLMEELAMKLRGKRMRRGAIDFDFAESKIIVNESGKPIDIIKRERTIAEMIIEEFMLAANETVAEHFHWMKVPFLYRIHEDPNEEKLLHFIEFAANFGYQLRGSKGGKVQPRALQKLLEEIEGTKEQTVISTVLLRSMKQARYDAESLGHFGLAAEYYSHFTSPIRRYPDLVIHRVMREVIETGALTEKRHEYLGGRMDDIARQSSERERVAVDAERETDDLKKAEFMMDKIGEEFDGIISSVTNFGIFVELDNTVEGLIRLSDMTDDYYHYHENQHALIGERTSKVYRIGDEARIRVARVSVDDHTIDFEMVDMKPRRARGDGHGGAAAPGRSGGAGAGARRERGAGGAAGASAGAGGRGKRERGEQRGNGGARGSKGGKAAKGGKRKEGVVVGAGVGAGAGSGGGINLGAGGESGGRGGAGGAQGGGSVPLRARKKKKK
jgi:ribonuclease R